MTPILTVNLRIKISPTIPVADVRIRVTPPHTGPFDPIVLDPDLFDVGWRYDLQPHINISVDDDLSSSIFPRQSREQVISPFLLSVGGNDIPYYRRYPQMTVSESIEGISSFSFSMPRRNTSELDPYVEPLGQPKAWLGVPGGKQSVDISAIYRTDSGNTVTVPIIKNGLLDNSSSQVNLQSDIRTWNGGGAHARVDRKSITYQAPPGHGQKSSTVVRKILELAGVESSKISVSGGRRMYKEISLIDAKPIESCNQILLPENRRLFHDSRTDTWTTVDYSGIEGKRVECIITESDVLEAIGALGDSEANDAPTSIILTSTAQVTRDQCGRRTEYKVKDVIGSRAIDGARFTQGSDGSLTPISWRGSASAVRLISRQVIVTEYDCETVIAIETSTFGWFSPEGWRYERQGDITVAYRISGTTGYIYDSGASKDDSSPMYEWSSEKFTLTSWQREEYEFDSQGHKIGVTVRRGGWRSVEVPVKVRGSIADPWESETFEVVRTMADGSPVENSERWYGPSTVYDEASPLVQSLTGVTLHRVKPSLLLTGSIGLATGIEREDISYAVSDLGFILSEQSMVTRWVVVPGSGLLLYQDNIESNSPPEFTKSESRLITYSATGESSHDKFTSTLRDNEQTYQEERGIPGYLPVADQRQDIVPPVSFFDNPADHEFALAASRHENRPIKVEINAPALESAIEPWQMKGVTVQYAENEQDLINLGTFMIRELSSIQIDYPLLLNTLLRPGHRVILHMPSLGIYYDHIILNLVHNESANISYTQVTGRYDVI